MFKTIILTTVLGFSSIMTYAQASDLLPMNDAIQGKIRTMLEGRGYQVRKIKIEDGMYEAYALKGGEKMEVILNAGLDIVKIEND